MILVKRRGCHNGTPHDGPFWPPQATASHKFRCCCIPLLIWNREVPEGWILGSKYCVPTNTVVQIFSSGHVRIDLSVGIALSEGPECIGFSHDKLPMSLPEMELAIERELSPLEIKWREFEGCPRFRHWAYPWMRAVCSFLGREPTETELRHYEARSCGEADLIYKGQTLSTWVPN